MVNSFLIFFVIFTLLLTVLMYFFSYSILGLVPGIRRLRNEKLFIPDILISNNAIGDDETLESFSLKKINKKLVTFPDDMNTAKYYIGKYTFGQMIKIVEYYNEKPLEIIVKDLNKLGLIIIIFGTGNLINLCSTANYDLALQSIELAASKTPFSILAVTELIGFTIYLVRIFAEINTIEKLFIKEII